MLELSIVPEDHDVQAGNVRVTWKVTEETLQKLAEVGCKNPQLLLISTAKGDRGRYREHRKIVPLLDCTTRMDFRTAGENRLFGIILFTEDPRNDVNRMRGRYLNRESGRYRTDVLSYDGSEIDRCHGAFERWANTSFSLATASINVVMPKECFAKEPSAKRKAWVNKWWRGQEAHDSCEFFWRSVWAYSGQLVATLIMHIITLVVGYAFAWAVGIVCLLGGLKGFKLKFLFWPFPAYTGGDNFDFGNRAESWFLPKTRQKWVRFITLPFMPVFPLAGFIVLKWLVKWELKTAAIWSLAAAFGLATAVVVVGVIVMTVIGAVERAKQSAEAKKERVRASFAPAYLNDPVLQSGVAMLADLPPSRNTFRLRFEDYKAKSCRPFSS